MQTYVVGDIHGRYEALLQCIVSSDYKRSDQLIVLGDIVDGGPKSKQVIDLLTSLPRVIGILGNHDKWMLNFINTGFIEDAWWHQGGRATLQSYDPEITKATATPDIIPIWHKEFLQSLKLYHVENNMLFVHGGISPTVDIKDLPEKYLIWTRETAEDVKEEETWRYDRVPYDYVFIGHTFCGIEPVVSGKIIMMDTGAGHLGKLTIMNIDTKEYWQSEKVGSAYD